MMRSPAISRRRFLGAAPWLLSASLVARPAFSAPGAAPLKFLVVGDWGRNGGAHQLEVASMMAREAADASFIVSTGDNFYTFGVRGVTDPLWRTSFQDVYYPYAPLRKPWFPVLGNHDYGGNVDAQLDRRRLDPNWQMRGRWYDVPGAEFGRPDVHLFFIDTVVWQGREAFPFALLGSAIPRRYQAAQKSWLEQALAASGAATKLVFGHHPIYSNGPHGGHFRLADLDAILRANRVTAYVNGHDHCLYHISHRGMDYICSGGGSQELASQAGLPPGCVIRDRCMDPERPIVRFHSPRAGFAAFMIHGEAADFALVARDGRSWRSPLTAAHRISG